MGDEPTIEDYIRDYNKLKNDYDSVINICSNTFDELHRLQRKYDNLLERYNSLRDLIFRFINTVNENTFQLQCMLEKDTEE